MHWFLLFTWASCVCLAVIGYGSGFLALCRLRNPPWALAGCIGIGLLVALGGFLELAGLIRPGVLFGLVLFGDVLVGESLWRRRHGVAFLAASLCGLFRGSKAVAALLLVVVALVGIRMIGNLEATYFQSSDDLSAYLSYPTEMLQRGSLPKDPFSERRIESALGGVYFLQTLTMLAGDARTTRFIDWGFGSALYVGIVFAICRRLKLSFAYSLALCLLTFVIPLRRQNATMLVLPAALFGALFLMEIEEMDDFHWGLRPLLLGMTAGAICTLKSSYLPAAVLVCGLYYLGELASKRRPVSWLQGGICALAAATCVLPWMLDQKNKEGTYLFPILGRGYEASAYGLVPLPSGSQTAAHPLDTWLPVLPLVIPFFVGIIAQVIAKTRSIENKWLEPITFFAAIAGGIGGMALATGGDSIARYTMSYVAPGVIVLCAFAVRWMSRAKNRPIWLNATLTFCVLWVGVVGVRYGIQTHVYREYMTDVGFPPLSPDIVKFDAGHEKERVAALQASIPAGAPILEHLFVSYPLDFRRNPVFIADFPGLAGSPPGMPVGRGPLPLRSYLLNNSIRFVAFTYGRGKFLDITPDVSLQALIGDPSTNGRHTWVLMQNKVSCDVQANIDALSKSYIRVYDDGESYVVDLSRTAGHA